MRRVTLAATFAIASALSSCAAGDVHTVSQSFANIGGVDDFSQDANWHDIPVIIRGAAFGIGEPALGAAVLDSMQGSAWGAKTRFTLESGPGASRLYSIALVIGAPAAATAQALCAHPNSLEPAVSAVSGGPLHITGALCRFDKAVSGIEGYAGHVAGIEDPQFRSLVAATVRDLTREQRPNRFKRDD